MAQIGTPDEEEKPRFASLQKNQSIETVTLEETLKLFELPRTLGTFREKEVVVGVGRLSVYSSQQQVCFNSQGDGSIRD